MPTTSVTAEIPTELAEKIDRMAMEFHCPVDEIVQSAIESWVSLGEERHRLTLEALADVRAGRVVEHEAVRTWAESLGTDHPLPLPQPRG